MTIFLYVTVSVYAAGAVALLVAVLAAIRRPGFRGAAAVRLGHEHAAERQHTPALRRVRLGLIGTIEALRIVLWWPAGFVNGVVSATRKARLRSPEVVDSLVLLFGVGVTVMATFSDGARPPLVAWTAVLLAVIILRNLGVLLRGEAHFRTFRQTPGSPYGRFLAETLAVAASVVGLSIVVGRLDGGTSNDATLVDTAAALLPTAIWRSLRSEGADPSLLRMAVNVAAVATYFILLAQILRIYRFRRTTRDQLEIAYAYLWLGDYASARRWLDKIGLRAEATPLRILLDLGEGRLDAALDRERHYVILMGKEPETDASWYTLYDESRFIPLNQQDFARLFELGVRYSVSDGALAVAVESYMVTGLDPRGLDYRLRNEGIDLARLPVTRAMIASVLGEHSVVQRLLAEQDYPNTVDTGHVAGGLQALAEYHLAGSVGRFGASADAFLDRVAALGARQLPYPFRDYVYQTLATVVLLARDGDGLRAARARELLARVVPGTGFTVEETIANRAEVLRRRATYDIDAHVESHGDPTKRLDRLSLLQRDMAAST